MRLMKRLALWGVLLTLPGCVVRGQSGQTTVVAEGWIVLQDLRGWSWIDLERWRSSYRGRVEYRQTE